MKTIKVKRLSENAKLPTRTHPYDGGLDIYASQDIFIPLGATIKVPTDVSIGIEPGYYAQIHDRSSLAYAGLKVSGGVIDFGFSGEVCVIMTNLNNDRNHDPYMSSIIDDVRGYQIRSGDKVAQILIHKIELPKVEEVDSFDDSERGNKGFGSSGR